ncbi:MAG: HAMP domain-containing histidine kinase [Williamsia sp.]|nr:HAMP domain-containing histidine kinase [Williamsia sp.]
MSIASQELKTPVTSIKAYAELLSNMLEEINDTMHAPLVHKLNSQIDRLTSLIYALLDTTKVSRGQLALHPESFNLNELINGRVEELQRTAPQCRLLVQVFHFTLPLQGRLPYFHRTTSSNSNLHAYAKNKKLLLPCGFIPI